MLLPTTQRSLQWILIVLSASVAVSNASQISVDEEFAGHRPAHRVVRHNTSRAGLESGSLPIDSFAIDGLDFPDSSARLLGESCDEKCMPGRPLCTDAWSELIQGVCKVRDVRTGAWAQRVHKSFGAGKKTVKKACEKAYARLGELIKNTLSDNEGVYWAVHKCAETGRSNRNIKCMTPPFPVTDERSSNGITVLVQGRRVPGYEVIAQALMAQGLASEQQVACCALDCDGNASSGERETRFYGGDYRTIKNVASASTCRSMCQDDARCKAWTYARRPRNRDHLRTCMLKDDMKSIQRSRAPHYTAGCMCGFSD